MAFFGIGESKDKNKDLADGVVHDSKQDQDGGSKDILEEFEQQFAPGGSAPAGQDAPKAVEPLGPTTGAPSETKAPEEKDDPFAPPKPVGSSSAPQPQAEPAPPEPVGSPATPPSAPRSESPSDIDLPDFDFDFHPSEPDQQSEPVQQTPPAAPQPVGQTAAQQVPSTPEPERAASSRFDLPDFSSDPFGDRPADAPAMGRPQQMPPREAQRPDVNRAPSWDDLSASTDDDPTGTDDEPESTAASPVFMDSDEQDASENDGSDEPVTRPSSGSDADLVIMRDGTLYIEKHALARQVHDLGGLRRLSSSADEQFKRFDSLSKEEKKLLTRIQNTMHSVYDSLEQADELLFKGE